MSITKNQFPVFKDSKNHFEILDGLRGLAAVIVVMFHILETFTGGDHSKQIINHGYLAVDFFFVLSGFVIGYAYDDRWGKMTLKGFFKRRLIRLHPMIIIGMIIGAITFYFQDSSFFPGIHTVPFWKMIVVLFIGFTLIPVSKSLDIRGWTEMHPLNGPAWSLFFEYIANILYALFIRKFSNKLLAIDERHSIPRCRTNLGL
jgi:peptidoglycan/LPS O-acetylase OafA/YrhL